MAGPGPVEMDAGEGRSEPDIMESRFFQAGTHRIGGATGAQNMAAQAPRGSASGAACGCDWGGPKIAQAGAWRRHGGGSRSLLGWMSVRGGIATAIILAKRGRRRISSQAFGRQAAVIR